MGPSKRWRQNALTQYFFSSMSPCGSSKALGSEVFHLKIYLIFLIHNRCKTVRFDNCFKFYSIKKPYINEKNIVSYLRTTLKIKSLLVLEQTQSKVKTEGTSLRGLPKLNQYEIPFKKSICPHNFKCQSTKRSGEP